MEEQLWWAINGAGFEGYTEIRDTVARYFPEVEMLQPTLGRRSPPEILLNYREADREPLDISNSGAGLRTFLTLARLLKQSSSKLLLLDEPDAHLHSSQQTVILNLLMDTALEQDKQVVVASHSPELIVRTPSECLRWFRIGVDTDAPDGQREVLDQLGATPDIYFTNQNSPDVIVYVEGPTDKPVIESLIGWCRQKVPNLPTAIVVAHRDGRFDKEALQAIHGVSQHICPSTRIVGIRDLDWHYESYDSPPSELPQREGPDSWTLLTLPCKELENLFCDPIFLYQVLDEKLSLDQLTQLVSEESSDSDLLEEWEIQIKPRMRKRFPRGIDDSTIERETNARFSQWSADEDLRRRLVAGKALSKRIRLRFRKDLGVTRYPQRYFECVSTLTGLWLEVAKSIYPDTNFTLFPNA